MDERMLTLPEQWARNATTNIPAPPIPGIAYRNAELDATRIAQGQQYSRIADSAEWNQVMYLMSGMIKEIERYGILPYCSLTEYPDYAMCMWTDGKLYTVNPEKGPVKGVTPENAEVWSAVKADSGTGAGLRRGGIVPYYNVTFGGSDGRRAIFWGETEADETYILCDGGSDGFGGTVPDLRDRMIIGASDTRPAGTIGGSADISLTGLTVGATTLTVAQLASHTHGVGTRGYFQSGSTYEQRWNGPQTVFLSSATGSSTEHTHALSGTSTEGSNIPPFYSLAFVVYVGEGGPGGEAE